MSPKKRISKKPWFNKLLYLACACIVLLLGFFIFLWSINLPNISDFSERRVSQSTKIYDRTGKILLYDIHGEEKRTIIQFNEIPQSVKNATIALEDDIFYQHSGIRPVAMIRAMITNLIHGSIEQGGSTITQQLVKKTLLTDEKTFVRKIKEIVLALKIEQKYSKDEILNLYLNQIPYGSSAYGIQSAAQTFFSKDAKDLSLLESAYLASLPRAPTYYSPCGKNREKLNERAQYALTRMKDLGFITEQEYENAKKSPIEFKGSCYQGIIAPHFVIEIKDELVNKFGEDAVESGGLKVTTTLDVDLQKSAEETINNFAEDNAKKFNAHNISVVSIDPKTGDILSLVGSKNYFAKPEPANCSPGVNCLFDPQVNIAVRKRQPGSAFKPFVYATAFKKGYTPDTVLFDLPTEFNPSCPSTFSLSQDKTNDKCYHPQNYDGKYRGPITLRESLAQSLNVPSVKILYLTGIKDALATARDFGITSLNDPDRLGLSLVLGGGEVSLIELTSAYGVFANEGIKNPYRYILKIEDSNNNVLFDAQNAPSEVIDRNIANTINDVLSDNVARTPAFGDTSALYFSGKKVAAKTGTTNDYRDAWIVGYTPSVVIGAWAGNNDNTAMEKKVAGFIIAPIWHEIMQSAILHSASSEDFVVPDTLPEPRPVLRGEWRGGKEYIIDKTSGKLATDYTPPNFKEKKVVMSVHSILYWLDKNNPLGKSPIDPDSDPQFRNWEEPIRRWALSQGLIDQNDSVIPTEYDTTHTINDIPRAISINIDPKKDYYNNDDTINIVPQLESTFNISQVDYFINDDYIGTVKNKPFSLSFSLSNYTTKSSNEIRIKIYDVVGNTSEFIENINIAQ